MYRIIWQIILKLKGHSFLSCSFTMKLGDISESFLLLRRNFLYLIVIEITKYKLLIREFIDLFIFIPALSSKMQLHIYWGETTCNYLLWMKMIICNSLNENIKFLKYCLFIIIKRVWYCVAYNFIFNISLIFF